MSRVLRRLGLSFRLLPLLDPDLASLARLGRFYGRGPSPPSFNFKFEKVSTGVRALDDLLEGGVETCAITEFIGEFGAGKTQLCHQLAVMVQLPPERGGLSARCLYIDTEGTFRPERVVSIARYRGIDPEKALEGIVYARAYNSDHLVELLRAGLALAPTLGIKLLIVDSPFSPPYAQYGGKPLKLSRALWRIARLLRRAADSGLAVVATNHVRQVPGEGLVPTGGVASASLSTHRLWIYKLEGARRLVKLLSSPAYGPLEAVFKLSEEGVLDEAA